VNIARVLRLQLVVVILGAAIAALTLLGAMLLATSEEVMAQTTSGGSSNERSEGKAPLQKVDKGSIEGHYIVVLNDNVSSAAEVAKKHGADEGFTPDLVYKKALNGYATKLSDAQLDKVRSKSEVKFVSLDHEVEAAQKNDSTTQKDSSSTQPSSKEGATAQSLVPISPGDSAPTGVKRINAGTGTNAAQPSDVNVAVIDTGIDLSHPDLNVANGTNCVSPGSPAQDDNGHGTHVAGTIGAKNNGSGVIGVAPGTKLYAAKVLNSSGSGTLSQIICGVDWVTQNTAANNIKVANMSLSGSGLTNDNNCGNTNSDALHLAICNSTTAGVTYVVAAGNSGVNLSGSFPADYPEVLTVTAMGDSDGAPGGTGGAPTCRTGEADDRYASFSNFAGSGAVQDHTIAGPGVCINSTWMGGAYNTISGTSMAAPHVSGSVANCISNGGAVGPCNSLTPAQIISRLRSDAQAHANSNNGFTGDPQHPVSGQYYGYLVDDTLYLGTPDSTAPTVSLTAPANGSRVRSTVQLTATASDDKGVKEVRFFVNGSQVGAADSSAPYSVSWNSATVPNGQKTITAQAFDAAGNKTTSASSTVTVDNTRPTLKTLVASSRSSTGVPLRQTNFTATFSEAMTKATLNKVTYKLYKCASATDNVCAAPITNVTVTPSPSGLSATLNPFGATATRLAANTKYKVVVTIGTKDLAGNPLAQQKVAYFKTGTV
jgi:subtilisin